MLLKIQNGEVSSMRLKRAVNDQIRRVMLDISSDDLTLLECVGRGAFFFRTTFIRAFPRGTVDETVADKVFAFFCAQVVQKFGDTPVSQLLDAMEVHVERPPTETEIDNAWEFSSASSQDARRAFDLPTGDYRKDPGGVN